jgi:hypothetical protein
MTLRFLKQQRHQFMLLLLTQELKSYKAVTSAGLQAQVTAGRVASEAFTTVTYKRETS